MQAVSWIACAAAAFLAALVVVIGRHFSFRLGLLRWPFGMAIVATVGTRLFLPDAPGASFVIALISIGTSVGVLVLDMEVFGGTLADEPRCEP